jgi:hypothetical protein
MQVRIQKPVEPRRPAGPHGDASLSSTRRAIVSRRQRCLPLAGEGRRNASAQVALWGMTSPKIRNLITKPADNVELFQQERSNTRL